MPIKYQSIRQMDYDFEFNLAMVIASCLVISSLVLGRFQRCLFNADSAPNSNFTLLDLSTDILLLDLYEGFSSIFHYSWKYVAFDWFHILIMANGGNDWLARNGQTVNNEDTTVRTSARAILDRIFAKDRTVSHIFQQKNVKSFIVLTQITYRIALITAPGVNHIHDFDLKYLYD